MKLGIYPFPEVEGLIQIGSRWLAYDSLVGGMVLLDEEVMLPDDIYEIDVNLSIPQNSTYYFVTERILASVDVNGDRKQQQATDVNGDPIVDANGDPVMEDIITRSLPSARCPRKNEDGLQSANIFPDELPYMPILTSSINDDGDLIINSSYILPVSLNLDNVFWTVYDTRGNLKYSQVTDGVVGGDEALLNITIPSRIVNENNELTVTAVHSTGGVTSPHGTLVVDNNLRIKSITSTHAVNSHLDLFFKYLPVNNERLFEIIKDIELIDLINNQVVETFTPNENNTILISRDLLHPRRTYSLNFRMIPRDGDVNLDSEQLYFHTIPEYVEFFTDPERKYDHDFRLHSSATLRFIGGGYVEKREDGRFIGVSDAGEVNWFVMNRGVSSSPYDIESDLSLEQFFVTFSLHRDLVLLACTDKDTGQEQILICQDDYLGHDLNVKETINVTNLDFRSLTFVHAERKVYFFEDGVYKSMDIDSISGAPRVISTLPPRPDGENENTQVVDTKDGFVLMFSGTTDNTYLYSLRHKTYNFISVIPAIFEGVKLQHCELINGDFIFFPVESALTEVLIYSPRTKEFTVRDIEGYIPNGDYVIKSNGVVVRHDGNATMGYYE